MTELVLVAVADLPGLAGLAYAVDGGIEILQQLRHPRTLGFRDRKLQPREPLEDAPENELHEGPL